MKKFNLVSVQVKVFPVDPIFCASSLRTEHHQGLLFSFWHCLLAVCWHPFRDRLWLAQAWLLHWVHPKSQNQTFPQFCRNIFFKFPFKWNKHIGYRKLWFVLELFVFCIPFNFTRWDLLSARTHPVKIHKAAVFFTTITLEKLYNDSRRWDPLLALEEMQNYGLVTSNCWEIFLSLTIDE